MADPLRRTLLAKLRGKKSKKGTTAGGCGVAAANGGREGKEKVSQTRDTQTRRAIMIAELDYMSNTMRGKQSYFNGGLDNRVVHLVGDNAVVFENAFPHYESSMHVNTSRGDVQTSGGPRLGGRDNEKLLGVSVQSEILDRRSDRDEMKRFHKQEVCFPKQVPRGDHREPHEQRKQLVPFPRRHTGGDSIGFGNCENAQFKHRPVGVDRRIVKLTDGQELSLENNGTNVGNEKDLETQYCDRALLVHRDGSFSPAPEGDQLDSSKFNYINDHLSASSVTTGETQMFNSDSPHIFHYIGGNVDEHDLIRTIERSVELCSAFRMPALQSPTFFPTELETIDADVASRLVCAPEGTTRHHSVDSDDDDYYDNEILPFYESGYQNPEPNDSKETAETSPQSTSVQIIPSGPDANAQETDRLRSRLKEAFYLLINAMHDIAFDGQASSGGCAEQSGSSSQSHDSVSVCSWSSSTWPAESDAWCSREHGVQRASRWSCSAVGGVSRRSRSLQSLAPPQGRPLLQRSVSDGGVRYPTEHGEGGSHTENESGHAPEAVAMDAEELVSGGKRCLEDVVPEHEEEEETILHRPTASPRVPAVKPAPRDAQRPSWSACPPLAKPPGVTVNKMQEWMHRGRVLSSEMRQRLAGSSLRGPQGPVAEGRLWARGPGHALTPHVSTGPAGTPQPVLTAPLNSITVSKKRNWLHQSSTHPSLPPDDVPPLRVAEDDHPSSSHPVAGSAPDAPCVKPGSTLILPVDPAEENDADDEGEIWYNPIPEDEETELSPCASTPRPAEPCVGPGGEEGGGEEGGGFAPAADGDGESGNAVRSGEQSHLTQQTCGTQEENLPTHPVHPGITETSDQGVAGSSLPSSPNPAKKSCSIGWSLPERIRSPRTVRKLSMKMKMLPELSRKLSVKGNPTGVSNGQSESRVNPARANVAAGMVSAPPRLSPGGVASASGNVIWRYHLDSSVSTQPHKKKSSLATVPKSASKGGYLSDGDSPELVAKSSKHGPVQGKPERDRDVTPGPRAAGSDLDVDAFRPYSFAEQPRCALYLSGLMSVHLCGAEGLKPPRVDSRDVYCAIQVDSVNKARTALLACRTPFLDMDHNFNIELENAQHLKLAVFSWEAAPQRRNRVCCHGTVALPPLFWPAGGGARAQRLAVRLEPRGVIYVRLGLMERWANSLDAPEGEAGREARVFGADAARVVEREGAGGGVPLLIQKCIGEIERRGCQVVGLYRLCGSAAVKKELREAFERDSRAVELSESNYPDINVITGVLKDYLRELPSPLISRPLYEAVLDTMSKRPLVIGCGGCENDPADSDHAVCLLEALPEVDKATLRKLLDHLKRVASHHEVNKMTCQNLAVCFGPVLLRQRQDAVGLGGRVFVDSEELASALHFKKHIEVLHYLLQLWPVVDAQSKPSSPVSEPHSDPPAAAPVRRRKERPQVLNLNDGDLAGVLRPRPGRLDSPSNRYAGDWSGCRDSYLQPSRPDEADYDDVPPEKPPTTSQQEMPSEGVVSQGGGGASELEAVTVNNDVADIEEDLEMEVEADLKVETEPESGEEHNEEDGGIVGKVVTATVPACCDGTRRDDHAYQAQRDNHAYQAYVKIQEIPPVLSRHVNLRDLQESIDTLIGNLEQELNKNKLSVGYGLSH